MKRIAVTGPESTGKSSLSVHLAKHYHTVHVPEYAREYIEQLNRPYTRDDILLIARNQVAAEKQARKKARDFLFCDTELIVTKVWSMHKYNSCHPWILEQIEKQNFDLYLLCDVDLPWQYDEQREHPQLRSYFFEWYKRELEEYGFPYRVVSGSHGQRQENAIGIINQFFHPAHD